MFGASMFLILAQDGWRDLGFWLWVAMILASLGIGAYLIIRARRMASGSDMEANDLSLEDLQRFRETGIISRVEYEAARTVILQRLRQESADMMKKKQAAQRSHSLN